MTPEPMPLASTTLPGATWRALARRVHPPKLPSGLDAVFLALQSRVEHRMPRRAIYMRRAAKVHALSLTHQQTPDAMLREHAARYRETFRLGRATRTDHDAAFALICEIAFRTLAMRPHIVQIAAAFALSAGCIAELATGEGKTLVATLPAVLAGFRGKGCHIVTVNDYLAERDAKLMAPLYQFCSLTVAPVTGEMKPHERRAAYLADITYTTNKELAADFLRDRLTLGRHDRLVGNLLARLIDRDAPVPADQLVMRGLACAIVDEADSVLIDEAVTPLIISGPAPNSEQTHAFAQAADIARQLNLAEHFRVDRKWREVTLTDIGRSRIDALCENLGGIWAGHRRTDELVTQALTARALYEQGKQYVVREGKVVIVDEFTGRLMPDRTWRDGLHQAVEAKEQLEIQPAKSTLARVSFQRFFRMYDKLSGMTGTAWEARHELYQTYRTPVVRIPTHKPIRRIKLPDRICRTSEARWNAVIDTIRAMHAQGRPVLIGTRSVEASEQLGARLTELNLPHQVLNAVRHAQEAGIVAEAGQPGRITVATNMAGRGTDIKLGEGVPEAGGLAVIATERNESGRIDRQLFGRSGRQGDPGSAEAILCLDDELMRRYAPSWVMAMLNRITPETGTRSRLARCLVVCAQNRAQRISRRQRFSVQKSDDWIDENLSFAGAGF